MVPMVSKAMGTNVYLPINSEYFCSFLAAAASAAEPADRLDDLMLLAARVCYCNVPGDTFPFRPWDLGYTIRPLII